MTLVQWCPECKLPLTAEEAKGRVCTMCGAALAPAAPTVDEEAAARERLAKASGPSHWPLWAGASLLLLSLLVAGVVVANWPKPAIPDPNDPLVSSDEPVKPVEKPKPRDVEPKPTEAMGPPIELKAKPVVAKASEMMGPPESLMTPAFVPSRRVVVMGPPEELKPPPSHQAKPVVNGNETTLDDTEGEFFVDSLSNNKVLILKGRIKRLRIGDVNHAILDASQLEAKEIVILRNVSNEATLKLNAPNGRVEFRGQLNRGRVNLTAPNGAVTFKNNGAQITNETKLTIAAGSVDFQDLIHGQNTLILLNLNAGGRLRFKEISSGSKVFYKRPAQGDPDLEIIAGDVVNQGELKKID